MDALKTFVKRIPIVGFLASRAVRVISRQYFMLRRGPFPGSQAYWEKRYSRGETSGAGSYGMLAEFKAEVLNSFVLENEIQSVIEFGCGDGHQLSKANYPRYVGLDVSKKALELCEERFSDDRDKSFFLYDPDCFIDRHGIFMADLALSLDVIFHLVEDDIFDHYMQHLFSSASRFVIIYSSNVERKQTYHERHRQFTTWIDVHATGWQLVKEVPNKYPFSGDSSTGSPSHFFIYGKDEARQSG